MKRKGTKAPPKPTAPEVEEKLDREIKEGDFQDYQMTEGTEEKQGIKPGWHHELMLFLSALGLILVIVLGIMLIAGHNPVADNMDLAGIFLLIILGMIYILFFSMKGLHDRKAHLREAILLLIAAALVWFLSAYVAMAFALVCGLLGFFLGLFALVNAWRQHRDGVRHIGWNIFIGLVYIAVSLVLLFSRDRVDLIRVMTGWYLLVFACDMLWGVLLALFHLHPELKHRFTISLPIIVAALLPNGFFTSVNEMVRSDPKELKRLEEADDGAPPDMVIYVHTRAGVIPGFGHCDLLFDGKVYSYGDYDDTTQRLGGFFAAGVMGLIPPEKQIEFALSYSKKILVAFGLRLSDEQKEAVRKKLDEIMSKSYYWAPKAQQAEEGKIPGPPDKYTDIASMMYLVEGTKFYKFEKGSNYRTYYGLGMNCVELVNDVVGATGLNLIKFNGIISPGNYLEYLDSLYLLGNTIVVDRRLYRIQNDKPVEIPLLSDQPIDIAHMSN